MPVSELESKESLHTPFDTHASILLLHGIDMQIVAERLGDSVVVVSTVYAHVLDEMRDKNRDEIKRISASLYA